MDRSSYFVFRMTTDTTPLARPLTFRSGLTIQNRFAKSATSEKLANRRHGPDERLARLYERWGGGGSGLLLTGNVQIDPTAREGRGNVVVEDDRDLPALREWAARARAGGAKLIMQVSHAGRQTPRAINPRPVAPSAVQLAGVGGLAGKPRELADHEIEILIERFARTAAVARAAGFDGVQLHGAHGYLINQFLSPYTNRRTDRWGGSLDNRMRFALRVARATRAATSAEFSISIKLNSADFQRGGFTEEESMIVAEALDAEGMDFIEVSGGSYESSVMFNGVKRDSTRAREAYFLDYVERVRDRIGAPLMLTGGFRTAAGMAEAVAGGAVAIVGMARPLIVEPDLPARILDGRATEAAAHAIGSRNKLVNDLIQGTWYGRQLRIMGDGHEPRPAMGQWWPLVAEGLRAYGFNPLASLIPRRATAVAELPAMVTE
jgi:2,4-dienoyl-CoA reductase-like NADH-dependent reductase (Old Yellow Enzyme family)